MPNLPEDVLLPNRCACGHDHSAEEAQKTAWEADHIENEPQPLTGVCACDVESVAPEVWPDDIEGLKKVLDTLDFKLGHCQRHIKALAWGEEPEAGVTYAQQIHKAKQLRMMLQYQRDLCQARIKSLEFKQMS